MPENEYMLNWANWPADSVLTLTNMNINSDYKDVVEFENAAGIDAYIDSKTATNKRVIQSRHSRINEPVRVDIPFTQAMGYNYLRVSNPARTQINDGAKNYYYFITGVREHAPNTVELIVQLDVWTTYRHLITFGNAYLEQGHAGVANEDQFASFGREHLTVPEGLNLGAEYQVVAKRNQHIMQPWTATPVEEKQYNILVVATADLGAIDQFGTKDNPEVPMAKGGNYFGLPSAADYWIFENAQAFEEFGRRYAGYSWIQQCIISITVIPSIKRWVPDFQYAGIDSPVQGVRAPQHNILPKRSQMFPGWRNSEEILNRIPERYRHLKKFFTFPYMAIELTNFTGTPYIIRPEAWFDSHATLVERVSLLPPNQKLMFSPESYNSIGKSIDSIYPDIDPGNQIGLGDDNGSFIDVSTSISNFPPLAILNNMAIQYMAANAHRLSYGYESADWSYTKASRGISTGYDQAQAGISAAQQQNALGRRTDNAQTQLGIQFANDSAAAGMLTGPAAAGASGAFAGPAGAAAGASMSVLGGTLGLVGLELQKNMSRDSLDVRNRQANMSTDISTSTASFVADTNRSLAQFAAKGDNQQAVAAINAQVQDAMLTPPSIVGQVGGEALNLLNNMVMVSLRWKMPDAASIRTIGDYWLRYGYAIQRFTKLPASLHVMSAFSYWRASEVYISGKIPEGFKQTLRGIIEKGVTVWRNPDDIGNIYIDQNEPIAGYRIP